MNSDSECESLIEEAAGCVGSGESCMLRCKSCTSSRNWLALEGAIPSG